MGVSTSKHALERAKTVARELCDVLRRDCTKIAIAGSIRRRAPQVKDIEIVCVPKLAIWPRQLFDNITCPAVDLRLNELLLRGDRRINKRLSQRSPDRDHDAWPEKHKEIRWQGIKVDLYCVTPPAQWGLILAIRTGPKEFSRRLVTHQSNGGLLPDYMRVQDGQLLAGSRIIETPSEASFFEAIGVPMNSPWQRT